MNVELFALIITWLAFVLSTGLALFINFIWYAVLSEGVKSMATRKLELPIVISIVSGIALWVYYYGGPPL